MKKGWNILASNKDEVVVRYLDGEIVTVRTDGMVGYGFVKDYLQMMGLHYDGQIKAADCLLQLFMGSRYAQIKRIKNVYEAHIVAISIRCAFGRIDEMSHCDLSGNLHFTYASCPIRPVCPFNGYGLSHQRNGPFGCNPVYETGLTPQMVQVAGMLATTSYDLSEIAEMLHLSEGRIRNIASEIYTKLEVANRQELMILLKDKRIG